jgi:hypothetical protein
MTKRIELTQGKVAIVDDDDFKFLMQWYWYYSKGGYAVRNGYVGNKRGTIYMSCEIMKSPSGSDVDHISRNKLDNRKENLRICSRIENMANTSKHKNNTSGYKGVSWHKASKKWLANISIEYKRIHLGLFDSPIEAARAYDKAAKESRGNYAILNFPEAI